MAKSTPFSIADIERKGYKLDHNGTYSKSIGDYEKSIKAIKSSKGLLSATLETETVGNSPDLVFKLPVVSVLTIDGVVAGLNGSHGLMQSHWSKNSKQKELYRQIIRNQLADGKIRKHTGEVKIQYIGYKSRFMDWDNFASSFKFLGDSLVKEKVIIDDSPKYVIEFLPKQIKCKQVDQKVLVIITDIN